MVNIKLDQLLALFLIFVVISPAGVVALEEDNSPPEFLDIGLEVSNKDGNKRRQLAPIEKEIAIIKEKEDSSSILTDSPLFRNLLVDPFRFEPWEELQVIEESNPQLFESEIDKKIIVDELEENNLIERSSFWEDILRDSEKDIAEDDREEDEEDEEDEEREEEEQEEDESEEDLEEEDDNETNQPEAKDEPETDESEKEQEDEGTEEKQPEVKESRLIIKLNLNNEDKIQQLQTDFGELEIQSGDFIRFGNFITISFPEEQENRVRSQLDENPAFSEVITEIYEDQEVAISLSEVNNNLHTNLLPTHSLDGAGVRVAVLDTGIDRTHPMLQHKVLYERSFVGDNNPLDENGHGTQGAAAIAGLPVQYNGDTLKGIASGADLINAKVIDAQGNGKISDILEGLQWSINHGAKVVVMSFGGAYKDFDSPLVTAMNQASQLGIIFVTSSGNCGIKKQDTNCNGYIGVTTPGISTDAITVGSIDSSNVHSRFSSGEDLGNYIKPDLVTYGEGIDTATINNGFDSVSGTSISASVMAGVAAVIVQEYPSITPVEIKELLTTSAYDLDDVGVDVDYGAGSLDFSNLLGPHLVVRPFSNQLPWRFGSSSFTDSIYLSNTGNQPLVINSITVPSSVSYQIIDNSNDQIFSRQTKELQVTYTGDERQEEIVIDTNERIVRIPFSIVDEARLPMIENLVYDEYLIKGVDDLDISFDASDDSGISSVEVILISPDREEIGIPNRIRGGSLASFMSFISLSQLGEHNLKIRVTDDSGNVVEEIHDVNNLGYYDYGQSKLAGDSNFIYTANGQQYFSIYRSALDYPCVSYDYLINGGSCNLNVDEVRLLVEGLEVPITSSDISLSCSVEENEIKICADVSGSQRASYYDSQNRFKPNTLSISGSINIISGNSCAQDCDTQDGWYGEFSEVCHSSKSRRALVREYKDFEADASCQCQEVFSENVPYFILEDQYCPGETVQGSDVFVNYITGVYTSDVVIRGEDIPLRWDAKWTHDASQTRFDIYWHDGDYAGNGGNNYDLSGANTIFEDRGYLYDQYQIGDWIKVYHGDTIDSGNIPESWCDTYPRIQVLQYNYYDGEYHEDFRRNGFACDETGCGNFELDCPQPGDSCREGYINDRYCEGGDSVQEYRNTDCSRETRTLRSCNSGFECVNGYCKIENGCVNGYRGQSYCDSSDPRNVMRTYRDSDCDEIESITHRCTSDERCQDGSCVPNAYVKAEPRCSNNDEFSVCYAQVGEEMGINNDHHTSNNVDIDFVCYDWWNDNTDQASIYLDGRYWDLCHGDCSGVSVCDRSTDADEDWILDETWAKNNREVRVLVAGSSGSQNYYDQKVMTFTWTENCPEEEIGAPHCGSDGNIYVTKRNRDCQLEEEFHEACDGSCIDGSCFGITCSSDLDCPSTSFISGNSCNQDNVWATQEVHTCQNPGTEQSQCARTEQYVEKLVCNDGCASGRCVEVVSVESSLEYGGSSITKQPGDYVTVRVDADRSGDVSFTYPQDFQVQDSSQASNNLAHLDYGENKITFLIPLDVGSGEYVFELAGNRLTVDVVTSTDVIIVTDSEALNVEFTASKSDVEDLLEEAYDKDAVVYDLADYSDELPSRPWTWLSQYQENALYTAIDNAYALAAADLVRDKCGSCKSILILGDDFVVPHYRRDISDVYNSESDLIYSDTIYVPRTKKQFTDMGDMYILESFGTSAKIILPNNPSTEMEESADELRDVLISQFNRVADIIEVGNLRCDSFTELSGMPIFIVGDEENNPLLKCYPFFSEISDTISISRNIWDNHDNLAVIVNSNNPEATSMLAKLIESGAYGHYEDNMLLFLDSTTQYCSWIIIPYIDVVGDVCSVGQECVFHPNIGWCGASIGAFFLPVISVKAAKVVKRLYDIGEPGIRLIKNLGGVEKAGQLFIKFADEGAVVWRKVITLLNKFPEDVLKKFDSEFMFKVFKVVKHYVKHGLSGSILDDLGRLADNGVPGVHKQIENLAGQVNNFDSNNVKNSIEGFEKEVKRSVEILDSSDKISLEVSKKVTVPGFDKPLDADIYYELTDGTKVIEEIKNKKIDSQYLKSSQFEKLGAVKGTSEADKVVLITTETITEPVKQELTKKGIEFVEGWQP